MPRTDGGVCVQVFGGAYTGGAILTVTILTSVLEYEPFYAY
jgi:hypothetical protein